MNWIKKQLHYHNKYYSKKTGGAIYERIITVLQQFLSFQNL